MDVFCGVSSCVGARIPLLLPWPQIEVTLVLRQNRSYSTQSAAAQSLLRHHRALKKSACCAGKVVPCRWLGLERRNKWYSPILLVCFPRVVALQRRVRRVREWGQNELRL